MLKENVYSGFDKDIFVILLLMVLACCLCWVYQPRTRIDGFSRGFAVFAMLSVASPYQQPSQGTEIPAATPAGHSGEYILGFGYALAAEAASESYTTIVHVKFQGRETPPPGATVTIRDLNTGKILGRDKIGGPIPIAAPPGKYQLEVEAPGYRRTRSDLEITEKYQFYVLSVDQTIFPLGIQRLWSPSTVPLHTAAEKLGQRHGSIFGMASICDFQVNNKLLTKSTKIIEEKSISGYDFRSAQKFRDDYMIQASIQHQEQPQMPCQDVRRLLEEIKRQIPG